MNLARLKKQQKKNSPLMLNSSREKQNNGRKKRVTVEENARRMKKTIVTKLTLYSINILSNSEYIYIHIYKEEKIMTVQVKMKFIGVCVAK